MDGKRWVPAACITVALGCVPDVPVLAQSASGANPPVIRDCPECPEMIALAAGKLMMGSPVSEKQRDRDEQPVHAVTIPALAVGRFEVTFEQWDACVAAGGCKHKPNDEHWGRGKRPVMNVSWDDAREYARWLAQKTGKPYRLLTEAEWEYAARAGTTTRFYWGDSDLSACDYASVRSDWLGCGAGRTSEAGARRPNAFGLYDMAGSVWEWTEDCYHENYEGAPGNGGARTGAACKLRVTRGGAWDALAHEARSANRNPRAQSDRNYTIGLRVARSN